jgi:predicted acetyltransferase
MCRIVKVKKDDVRLSNAIEEMNLSTPSHSYTSYGSGTVRQIEDIDSGYLVYLDKKIIGWGAIFDSESHIFIHRKYRNRGFGSKLVKRIVKDHPTNKFCPWNRRVQGFFNKRKVTYTKYYLF